MNQITWSGQEFGLATEVVAMKLTFSQRQCDKKNKVLNEEFKMEQFLHFSPLNYLSYL